MDNRAADVAETGVEPGNLRQDSGCGHDWHRDKTAGQPSQW
jgi:hypothetical protein